MADAGMFPVGSSVQYYSQSQSGWIQAVVNGHRTAGFYILDVHIQADPKKVRLPVDALVEYFSSSQGNIWVPAIVTGHAPNSDNVLDFSYVLDIHPKAPTEKVRVRQNTQGRMFIVGGKEIWANSAEEALAKAAGSATGFQAAGFPHAVRSIKSLPSQAKEFYNLLHTLANQGGYNLLQREADKYLQKFDTNHDGCIDLGELKALVADIAKKLTLPSVDPKLVTDLFDRYDRDKSGVIEKGEFLNLFRRLIRRMLADMKVCSQENLLRECKKRFDSKYTITKPLSAGAQGMTFLGKDKRSGEVVVIKKPNARGDIEDFENLAAKTHPNIVKVIELFNSPVETFVVMEACNGGDLFKALKYCRDTFKKVPVEFYSKAIKQVMVATEYLHAEFKECHNDIKPENILLDRKPEHANDVPRIMLADFGCASGLGADCNGDPRYNAPELWLGAPVRYDTDVWALGIVLYEMLSGGILAFTGQRNVCGWSNFVQAQNGRLMHTLQTEITKPGAQPDWSPISHCPEGCSLCQEMLTYDPRRRITLKQALQRPWITEDHDPNLTLPDDVLQRLSKRAEMSEMHMLLLNLVATKIRGEHLEVYETLWQKFDKDGNGTVSQEEFAKIMESQMGFSRDKADDIFFLADIDGSKSINFTEFVAVMFNPNSMSTQQLTSHAVYVFGYMFAGREMTLQQFQKVFPGETERAMLTQLFQCIDKDNNGTVSLDEFVDFLSSM